MARGWIPWRGLALAAALAALVTSAGGRPADAALATRASVACADSWAAPVSGSWTDPSMWTSGVPGSGLACITVAGSYTVTLTPGTDIFVDQLLLGDGTASGSETLAFTGCRDSAPGSDPRDRLFVTSSLQVSPGGVVDMQGGAHCTGAPSIFSGIIGSPSATLTLGGTLQAEPQHTSDGLARIIAGSIVNTGTITANGVIALGSETSTTAFDNHGTIAGSGGFFGLDLPVTGATFTNEGTIVGTVAFFGNALSSTAGSTFANNAGGDIGSGGVVLMGAGTTYTQVSGTMASEQSGLGGFAELTDGSHLNLDGPGLGDFFTGGSVAVTGTLRPSQSLEVLGSTDTPGDGCLGQDATASVPAGFTNQGTIILRMDGTSGCPSHNAILAAPAGGTIVNKGTIEAQFSPDPLGSRIIAAKVTNLGQITIDQGTALTMSRGSIDNGGTVQAEGPLSIEGTFTQRPAGTTSVAVGSAFGSASVKASGLVSLAGTLDLAGDGVTPPENMSVRLFSGMKVTGTFAAVTGTAAGNGLDYQLAYTSSAVIATVAPTLTGIAVSPAKASVPAGGSLRLTATGSYSDGSTKNITGVAKWRSADPATAKVSGSGRVAGIAPGTVTITAKLEGKSATAVITVTVPPSVYVASASGRLTIIDRRTGKVRSVVRIGHAPLLVAPDPTGAAVYLASESGAMIVANGLTGAVRWRIRACTRPTALAVSPDGSMIYTACASGVLVVIDAATRRVLARVRTGGAPDAVAVSPDGSAVYLASSSGRLFVIGAGTERVIAAVHLTGSPDAVAASPDGSTVYVAVAAGRLDVVAASQWTLTRRTRIGGRPDAVAVSPDGSRIYVADATGRLDIIDVGAAETVRAIRVRGSPDAVAVSSDGSTVYVAARAATKLTVVDAVTGKIKRTIPVTAGSTSVAVTG